MSTPDQALDTIKARLEAATPGPWARPLNTRYRASETAEMPKGDPASRMRDNIDHEGSPERTTIVSCPIWSGGKFVRKQSGRDLEFIANAPTDMAKLLTAVESVIAQHKREVIAAHEGYGEEAWRPACRVHYPCPTIAALTATEGA